MKEQERQDILQTEEEKLRILLEDRPAPEFRGLIKRLGLQVTIKGLDAKRVYAIREQCTTRRKDRKAPNGERVELDEEAYNTELVAAAIVSPRLDNPELLAKLSLSGAAEVLKRKFLAGELAALADKVLELSGFDEGLDDVKN